MSHSQSKKTESAMAIIRKMAPRACSTEIARAIGLNHKTVQKWARAAGIALFGVEDANALNKEILSSEAATIAEFRRLFSYDRFTGDLSWKAKANCMSHVKIGGIAGHILKRTEGGRRGEESYRYVRALGREFPAHNVIWAIVHGKFPADQIDHINLDGTDNRLCNLREATRFENAANRRSKRQLFDLPKGVHLRSSRPSPYVARIGHHLNRIQIGCFQTIEEAQTAYEDAARRLHGKFARLE